MTGSVRARWETQLHSVNGAATNLNDRVLLFLFENECRVHASGREDRRATCRKCNRRHHSQDGKVSPDIGRRNPKQYRGKEFLKSGTPHFLRGAQLVLERAGIRNERWTKIGCFCSARRHLLDSRAGPSRIESRPLVFGIVRSWRSRLHSAPLSVFWRKRVGPVGNRYGYYRPESSLQSQANPDASRTLRHYHPHSRAGDRRRYGRFQFCQGRAYFTTTVQQPLG
jgi:hypothetical protein